MARRPLSVVVLSGAALLLRAAIADAAPWPTSLSIEATSCDASWLDGAELARAIRAELEADGVAIAPSEHEPSSAGLLSVSVACDAERVARVVLSARAGPARVEQRVPLADAEASSRARVLALAISELVRSAWPSLSEPQPSVSGATFPDVAATAATQAAVATPAPSPPSVPQPADHRPAEPSPRARAATRSGPRFDLSLKSRWFPDYASASWGADLGVDSGALRLRAEGLFGSKQASAGSAVVGSVELVVGCRVLEGRVGPVTIAGFPVIAAGVTWLRGEAQLQNQRVDPATGFYGDVRLLLEATVDTPKLTPTVSLEAGRATGFVARSGNETLGASGGFFVGAGAGGRY